MKNVIKSLLLLFCINFMLFSANAQNLKGSEEDRKSLDKATLAIRNAFAKGDAQLVAELHHPGIVKYFGGNNIITGKASVQKGAAEWFQNSKVEFVENKVESTIFNGSTAIQTVIFSIKTTPKAGGKPAISRGRSMVVYIKSKNSPTGWLSVREIVQAAPEKSK